MHRSLSPRAARLAAVLLFALVGVAPAAHAQSGSPARRWREAHEQEILREFTALLAIPNVARDSANIRRNADAIVAMMTRRGLAPRLLETPGAPPAVYGEWRVKGATRTLVFYAHYDGQPTDTLKWSGTHPWRPAWRAGSLADSAPVIPAPAAGTAVNPDWRIYARSASDDKAGVMAILTAVDALRAAGRAPSSNVKIFFEGEEEAGSPHLADLLARHRALLAGADAWIMVDGPVHQSGRKQVVFGARGDENVDITVYGPTRPLHSGHYGNWAPNPAMRLARLLSSMVDSTGRVTVAGWYDDVAPLGAAERAALAEVPRVDSALAAELGIARPDGAGRTLVELINEPSLNVNGFASADVGALSRNVIPTSATAALDLRLVKGVAHARQVERLAEHVRRQGYFVVDHDPTPAERASHALIAKVTTRPGAYDAERTAMDLPIARTVIAAVSSTTHDPVVRMPTLGGSLPLVVFRDVLGATTITVPIANYDNNQHAENENLRIGNLWDGIETMAAVMTMK
ncbi:MAG TPA: M20/M25/M40 family metallo-hydrolase, partial [Gemmatimonadaceae bacterium]|nr:M20/M25/M40 family metallo-hydrolase [Gemmatimonadaceae bacterium]